MTVLTPDRWLANFATTNIRPEVRPLILKENPVRLLGLSWQCLVLAVAAAAQLPAD